MLLSEDFHEKEYDGIVIKIPSWFIEMNNLLKPIDEFKSSLVSCKLSIMHPDYLRSVYEIDNYKFKKEKILKEKAETEESQKRAIERYNKIISGEIILLEWRKYEIIADDDNFIIGNDYFSFNDIFTKKLNIKSEFKKKFWNYAKDESFFIQILKDNRIIYYLEDYIIDYFNTVLRCSKHNASFQLSIPVLYGSRNVKKSGFMGYTYRPQSIKKVGENDYSFGGDDIVYGYEKKGMELIKITNQIKQ